MAPRWPFCVVTLKPTIVEFVIQDLEMEYRFRRVRDDVLAVGSPDLDFRSVRKRDKDERRNPARSCTSGAGCAALHAGESGGVALNIALPYAASSA